MQERKFHRYGLKVPLFISVRSGVFRRSVDLQSEDVSAGGLAFETSQRIPLEANTRIEISSLGDLPVGTRIEGRVVYRKKSPESGRYRIGVAFDRFVNVDPVELHARLERWEDVQATPV
jgi:c-di-GMP-binding flagellar brake protein YcgR